MLRQPFWREIARDGTRVVAIDVPYTPPPAEAGDTVEFSGWATNEVIFEPWAHPPGLENTIREHYGRLPRTVGEGLAYERFAPQPLSSLLHQRDQLVDVTDRAAELAGRILGEEPWDLGLVVFAAAHRAGHLMWSSSSVQDGEGPDIDAQLRDARRDVYVACDRAIGRMVEEAGTDGTTVLVCSLIGMAANTSRTDLLPAMLARVLAGDAGAKAGHERLGPVKRLRRAIPASWRHRLKSGLPMALQDRLTAFWRVGTEDWERTRAVSLTADVHGYVRINLRGREARGIVEPGDAYDRLCSEIAEGLLSFRDADTDERVVDRVVRIDELFPAGARLDALPDLIVRWAPSPSAATREIVSPTFGRIPWPIPGKSPNGRSGNHTGEGFVLAAGEGIRPGSGIIDEAHILDLPPTICRMLGREPLEHMAGAVIQDLLPDPATQPKGEGT
jgi:predicted AlkP superfamily phosphohydrolase/phosphomutase